MLHKKIIGTAIFSFALIGLSLTGYYLANAKNISTSLVNAADNSVGYGNPGGQVHITRATVTAITAHSFTVNTGTELITFQVDSSTNFNQTTFATLAIGDVVLVNGSFSGSSYLAKVVNLKK